MSYGTVDRFWKGERLFGPVPKTVRLHVAAAVIGVYASPEVAVIEVLRCAGETVRIQDEPAIPSTQSPSSEKIGNSKIALDRRVDVSNLSCKLGGDETGYLGKPVAKATDGGRGDPCGRTLPAHVVSQISLVTPAPSSREILPRIR